MSINVTNTVKTFGDVRAVDNVSLVFDENKIYGLLGRNGAGKTTLLNLITNRIFANSGNIKINDMDVTSDNSSLSSVYFMGEKTYYPTGMRVKDTFKWAGKFYDSFDMDYAMGLADKFEIDVKKKVSKLSTGYTTIFKIIIALSLNVDFILLDEPILGLDAYHRDMFYKELIKTYTNRPRTFVISTHLIEEVSSIIETVVIIDKGRIITNQTCEELLATGYTATGSTTSIDDFTKGRNVIDSDTIGNLKSAYILHDGTIPKGTDKIEISGLDLQKMFIKLTGKGGIS